MNSAQLGCYKSRYQKIKVSKDIVPGDNVR